MMTAPTVPGFPYLVYLNGERVTPDVQPPRPRGYRGSHRRPSLLARLREGRDPGEVGR